MKGRCVLPMAWDESQEKDTDICKSLVLQRHLWQTGPISSPERDTLLLFHGYYYLYNSVIIKSAPGSGTSHSFHGYLLIQAFWKEMRSIQTWKIKEELSSIKTISLSYKDVLSGSSWRYKFSKSPHIWILLSWKSDYAMYAMLLLSC